VSKPLAVALAERIAALANADLPPSVVARATDLLRDYLGVALAGAGAESSTTLRAGLRALAGDGPATVLGTSERLPAVEAAIANGAAAHTIEMDDTHQGGSIHLGATVFSAALAAAEREGASGMTVLRAAVAGYEVAARLAMALRPAAHYARGFHPTGTCGAFGAAAAAGIVFGLDAERLTAALGVAGSQASGSMEFLADGSWTKRFHPGWAAAAGLYAASLARAGFRAPATILEGRAGFLHAYSDGADAAAISTDDDGWELMRTGVKPHACCRYMQGPIDAVLALRAAHRLAPGDVAAIDVGMLEAGFAIVCDPPERKRRPGSVVDAQFSLPFGVAVALVHGAASPDEFAPARLAEPALVDVMARVTAVRDPALDAVYPRAWPTWVRMALRNGQRVEERIAHPKGDPENFPSAEELDVKFRTLAARALSPDGVARLAAAIEEFPRARDVGRLLAAAESQASPL
jgi:2-methylcitrate dehydratase PrpD